MKQIGNKQTNKQTKHKNVHKTREAGYTHLEYLSASAQGERFKLLFQIPQLDV